MVQRAVIRSRLLVVLAITPGAVSGFALDPAAPHRIVRRKRPRGETTPRSLAVSPGRRLIRRAAGYVRRRGRDGRLQYGPRRKGFALSQKLARRLQADASAAGQIDGGQGAVFGHASPQQTKVATRAMAAVATPARSV